MRSLSLEFLVVGIRPSFDLAHLAPAYRSRTCTKSRLRPPFFHIPLDSRALSSRRGEGMEVNLWGAASASSHKFRKGWRSAWQSAASKAGRGTHPTSGGGVVRPRCLSPDDFTPIHLWLALGQPERKIRSSSGRSPERESLVGSLGRVRGVRPGPSQPLRAQRRLLRPFEPRND